MVGQYYIISIKYGYKGRIKFLSTVSVHVTTEKNGKWKSSSDITVRLEEGKKLSEALSFLDGWESAVLSPRQSMSGLANPLFFLEVDNAQKGTKTRHLAKPDDLVQGSAFYAIQVTLETG